MRTKRAGAAVAAAGLLAAREARAIDAEITSDTAAQFYDVRSPTGEVVLPRRRVTTTLGVLARDLLGNEEGGAPRDTPRRGVLPPDLSFRARLRYDADYGADVAEEDPSTPRLYVPGYARAPVDVMYAYVEGRRLLGGFFGFRLGRQYVVDPLGWWCFDGGLARITTPFYVAAEAYAGLEARGGMPLSTARWERDGIWRGTRAGLDPTAWAAFQPAALAPAFGATVETAGTSWLHARASYRKVQNTGAALGAPYAQYDRVPAGVDAWRVSSERVGASVDAQVGALASGRAGVAYDLHLAKTGSAWASLDAFAGRRVTLSVDWDYFQPTFDGDSIWNVFAAQAMNDVGARASVDATGRLTVAGGARVKAFGQATSARPEASPNGLGATSVFPSSGVAFNHGGNLAVRYRWAPEGVVGLRGAGDGGDGGHRVGADVYATRVVGARVVVEGRASLWRWHDAARPDRDATSLGYVAGLGYRFAPRSQGMVEWQHDASPIAGHRFRLMVWLQLAVAQ